MREFAEEEIIIPTGRYAGRRYRCDRMPFTRLWFGAIDSGKWSRFTATGPGQATKTLSCFVIPTMYHLFEFGETVICGSPAMNISYDKWIRDIRPVIMASRYRDLIPSTGAGSKGGKVEAIEFRNGATLRFLSGGGSDKARAGYTSRVLVATETDGLDDSGEGSREADKMEQMEARLRSYGSAARIYKECTVSVVKGHIWQSYLNSTETRVAIRCAHCRHFVSPEREHLVGWQDAENEIEAMANAHFACPNCGAAWSEEQRVAANHDCMLLHAGQTVDRRGRVKGQVRATRTFGLRWSAVNNLFLTSGDFGADEWNGRRDIDEDSAERKLRQFVWCIPVEPNEVSLTNVTAHRIQNQFGDDPTGKGTVPAWAQRLTFTLDVGKWLLHWGCVAWALDGSGRIIDYGRIEVPSESIAEERAIFIALRQAREIAKAGWRRADSSEIIQPDQLWFDTGYQAPTVYEFIRECGGGRFRAVKGFGAGQDPKDYFAPKSTGNIVTHIGQRYHFTKLKAERISLVEIDANFWKTWVHQRLSTPEGEPGCMTIFQAKPNEHLGFAKHLTAEEPIEDFDEKKGVFTRWKHGNRNNHWFDMMYMAAAAAHRAGVRLVKGDRPIRITPKRHPRVTGGWNAMAPRRR